MLVKFKKLRPDAVLPTYAKPGDAGLDLVAVDFTIDETGNLCYHTGLAAEIPEGYVGLLFPRSSISKYGLALRNSIGVIDSGYRGDIIAKFGDPYLYQDLRRYQLGDKIAQLIILPYPQIEVVEASELSSTERGSGGFGSTGI